MKRYGYLQPYMDILSAVADNKNGVANIAGKASVNPTIAKEMLKMAVKRGEIIDNDGCYSLSEKGRDFLSGWKKYGEFSKKLDDVVK